MNNRILFASSVGRVVAMVTLLGFALTSQSAWAQNGGNKRNVRSKQAVSGEKHNKSRRGKSVASAKRPDRTAGGRNPMKFNFDEGGNRASMSRRSNRQSAGRQGIRNTEQGPLYPGGWESAKKSANRRTNTSAKDTPMGNSGGRLNQSAGQDGGGLWNSETGTTLQGGGGIFNDGGTVTRQSPFFGQDQETGEIIDFRANFKQGRPTATETQSLVNSEGWDEVPEDLMFGFRAGRTDRNRSGFGPVKPNQINSPRDVAHGLPSGKRR